MTVKEFKIWLDGFKAGKNFDDWSLAEIKTVLEKIDTLADAAPIPSVLNSLIPLGPVKR